MPLFHVLKAELCVRFLPVKSHVFEETYEQVFSTFKTEISAPSINNGVTAHGIKALINNASGTNMSLLIKEPLRPPRRLEVLCQLEPR